MKTRIQWIDIAKGITIIAMIIGHSVPYGSSIRNLIFSFHMPLFFILTGYTMREDADFKELCSGLKKDFLRLIVPMLLFQSVNFFLSVLLRGESFHSAFLFYLKQVIWASAVDVNGYPALGALWFLVVMFWSKSFYRGIRFYFPSQYSGAIYMLMAVLGKMISARVWLIQSFDIAMVAVLFLWLGNVLKENEAVLSRHNLPWMIFAFSFWMFWWQDGVYIEMGTRSYPHFIMCILEAVAGSVCIFALARSFEANELINKVMSKIGLHTLIILGVHHLDSWAAFLWSNYPLGLSIVLRCAFDLTVAFLIVYAGKRTRKMCRLA